MEITRRCWEIFLLLAICSGGLCCNSGWTLYNGNCYIASQVKLDYNFARKYCVTAGGDLAYAGDVATLKLMATLKNYDSQNNYWLKESSALWNLSAATISPGGCPYAWKLNVEISLCEEQEYFVCESSDLQSDMECPLGWDLYKSVCLKAVMVRANYNDSARQCVLQGGHVAQMDSEEKKRNALATVIWKNATFFVRNADNRELLKTSQVSGEVDATVDSSPDFFKTGQCLGLISPFNVHITYNWEALNCSEKHSSLCEMPARLRPTTPRPTLAPTTLPPLTCPHGQNWKSHEESGYCFWETTYETEKVNWFQARVFCQAYGGDLATYESDDQEEHGLGSARGHSGGLWFGLKRGDDDIFRWADGSRLLYSRWDHDEPNINSSSKFCVQHASFDSKWALDYCGVRRWFICKAPKVRMTVIPDIEVNKKISCNVSGLSLYRSWYLHDGHCYMAHEEAKYTWDTARTFCQDNQAEMASVHSFNETDFILSVTSLRPATDFWIGLSSSGLDAQLKWSDGTFLDFQYWTDESKSEIKVRGVDTCVSLNKLNGAWDETHCNEMLYVICKRKLHPISETTTPKPTTPAPGNCENGWYPIGNKCVKAFTAVSWKTARNICDIHQASLVTIHNQEEQDFLTDLLADIGTDAWIGLHTKGRDTLFHWTDGSRIDYTNWDHDEPRHFSDYHDHDEEGEHFDRDTCVMLRYASNNMGAWKDVNCWTSNPHICEKPKNASIMEPSDTPFDCKNISGWLKLGSSCYGIFENPGEEDTWLGAQSTCRQYGANLVSYENFAVTTFLSNRIGRKSEYYWTAVREKMDGKWELLDGRNLRYTNWFAVSPQTASNTMDNCVATVAGKWVPRSCQEKYPFICEMAREGDAKETQTNSAYRCPNTTSYWIDLGGRSCYLFGQTTRTWHDAMIYCFQHGGALASFHSAAEISLVTDYLKSNDGIFFMHIGLGQRRDGSYAWVDHSPIDFTNWEVDEPDEFKCTRMNSVSGEWYDTDCDEEMSKFLCSITKVTVSGKLKNEALTEEQKMKVAIKLTAGGILGIVICILVILAVVGVAIYYMWPTQKRRSTLLVSETSEN